MARFGERNVLIGAIAIMAISTAGPRITTTALVLARFASPAEAPPTTFG